MHVSLGIQARYSQSSANPEQAITEMVRKLRECKDRKSSGLILANGGVLTYQHVICLSNQPRSDGLWYPEKNPLPDVLSDVTVPQIDAQAEGDAIVEVSMLCAKLDYSADVKQTYTVEFGRDGEPLRGHIVGRLKSSGYRFIANHADAITLRQLSSNVEEQIGKVGVVWRDEQQKGRNLFSFEKTAKL